MERSPIVIGLAAVFAGMTVLLFVLAAVFRDPVVLFVAVPFAAATYFFWYHATGRLRESIRERARRQRAREQADGGGFGAGPRVGGEARTRFGREARQRRAGTGRAAGSGAGAGPRGRRVGPNDALSRREAYETLGVEQGADEETVRRAYREKVKEVHPDAEGGDEERFKAVNRAYERLTD